MSLEGLKLQKFSFIYKGNDLFIKVDGRNKKFCGFFHCELKGLDYYAVPLSFKVNHSLMKSIFRMDTDKMKRKGKIKKISDVVMGLNEIGITNKEVFIDSFVENLAERFDWEVIKGNFSEKENKQFENL